MQIAVFKQRLRLSLLRERTTELAPGYDAKAQSEKKSISRPVDVLEYAKALKLHKKDREHFICLHMDARNRPIAHDLVSVGSMNASLVHPREVFKSAILGCAGSVILLHNHPSGDKTPSLEDITLTKRMAEAGEILGIEVLDHIITGAKNDFISMKEANLF